MSMCSAPDKLRICVLYARKISGYAKKFQIKRTYNATLFDFTQIVLKKCVKKKYFQIYGNKVWDHTSNILLSRSQHFINYKFSICWTGRKQNNSKSVLNCCGSQTIFSLHRFETKRKIRRWNLDKSSKS